ncbi:MAG: heterodisulfide reductase-related iron-sulfur binding cluster [Candidatus Hodarchaeales archaeon]|jgi:Fe-S oxidoreductase
MSVDDELVKTKISYAPTDEMSYDPSESKYWQSFHNETLRVFEVCHGCRMCFKYCGVFPSLFDLIDNKYNGDVKQITRKETESIFKQCFQCKLCEFTCPYTPRDGHEFQLDFPRLVHRHEAQKWSKKFKFRLRDRLLGNVYRTGKMARLSLGLMNVMNRIRFNRWMMEKTIGIHKKPELPTFPMTTFTKWAKKNGYTKKSPEDIEVILFPTCYIDNNEPQIGINTIDVLEKNGVKVGCIEKPKCCGMPAWEHGDLKSVKKWSKANLKQLMPYVEKGAKILVIQPTCSMMMGIEWPELLESENRNQAKLTAEVVMTATNYLWSIRKEDRFNSDFKSVPKGEVTYHVPCHLRAQRKGFRGRDLIRKVTGSQPKTIQECSGHDGTFAIKVETYEESIKWGQKAIDGMKEPAEIRVSDCPLAANQFKQHSEVEVLHPMTFMARVYRENGFTKL